MNYSSSVKDRIRDLRIQGFSYIEINSELNISAPKSSLSYICKGVVVSDIGKKRLTDKNKNHMAEIRKKAKLTNRKILEKRFINHTIFSDLAINKVNIEGYKTALAMLYWGEGSKWKSYRGLSLGTSDPDMLQSYVLLLEKCYFLKRKDFRCRLILRADQDSDKLMRFWSKYLEIPVVNFYKSYFDSRTIGKPTKKTDYKGVCVISCPGTEIQLELEAICTSLLNKLRHPT